MRIHPSFRIVALAEPPDLTTASGQWLNAEMLSNFLFHHMTPLPSADEVKVIDSLAKHHVSETLFDLSDHLRRSRDPNVSLSCIKFVKICEESFVAVLGLSLQQSAAIQIGYWSHGLWRIRISLEHSQGGLHSYRFQNRPIFVSSF